MTHVLTVLAVYTLMLLPLSLSSQGLSAARAEAHAGNVDAAISDLAGTPQTAEGHALLCQLYGSIDRRDAAVSECEAASAAAPSNSDYALELARAYGEKAGHSGALTGMRMVGKIRANFERAVQLDGNSVDALSDLGQFYVEAPGIAGGGIDKARPIVARLQVLSPARAHRLAAMIAARTKDDAKAQQEFEAELVASHTPEAYVDLANFYKNCKQSERAAEYARMAIEHDPHHGPDTLDAASILINLRLSQAAAQAGLRAYLSTPQSGAVARYAKAHVLLGQSLQVSGDAANAQKEFAAALALAHEYDAARKGSAR